jgi:hypothetical protein
VGGLNVVILNLGLLSGSKYTVGTTWLKVANSLQWLAEGDKVYYKKLNKRVENKYEGMLIYDTYALR